MKLIKRVKFGVSKLPWILPSQFQDVEIILPIRHDLHIDEEPEIVQFTFIGYSPERIPLGFFARVDFDDFDLAHNFTETAELTGTYVVVASEMVARPNLRDPEKGNQRVYKHSLGLMDPIVLLDQVPLENLSFTDLQRVDYYEEDGSVHTATRPGWTIDKIIDRLLRLSGDYGHDNSWHNSIVVEYSKEQLHRIAEIGPINESFPEATLYDALFRLANYFDCVPKLECRGTADHPFKLSFVSLKGRTDLEPILWEDFSKHHSGWFESEGKDQLAQGLVSNVSGVTSNDLQVYPNYTDMGALMTNSTEYFDMPAKVSVCETVALTLVGLKDPSDPEKTGGVIATINIPCYPEELYATVHNKNAAHYSSGENRIYLTMKSCVNHLTDKELRYRKMVPDENKDETATAQYVNGNLVDKARGITLATDVKIYVRFYYKSYLDIRLRSGPSKLQETFFTQKSYNQSSTAFSAFFESYRKTTFNADLTLLKLYDTHKEVPPIGARIKRGEDIYVISAESMQLKKDAIKVTFALNKDMVKRSKIVTYSNTVRYAIPTQASTIERMINVRDKVTLALETTMAPSTPNNFTWVKNISFLKDLSSSGPRAYAVRVSATVDNEKRSVEVPAAYNVIGNSLVFSFGFANSIDLVPPEQLESYQKLTDWFGSLDKCDIELLMSEEGAISTYYTCLETGIVYSDETGYSIDLGNSALSGGDLSGFLQFYHTELFTEPGDPVVNMRDPKAMKWYSEALANRRNALLFNQLYGRLVSVYNNTRGTIVIPISKTDFKIMKDTAEKPTFTYQLDIDVKGRFNGIIKYGSFGRQWITNELYVVSMSESDMLGTYASCFDDISLGLIRDNGMLGSRSSVCHLETIEGRPYSLEVIPEKPGFGKYTFLCAKKDDVYEVLLEMESIVDNPEHVYVNLYRNLQSNY